MDNIAIKVDKVSKIYHLYDKPSDRLKEALNPFRKKYHHDFYALKDISFEVKKGETVGIIGQNGSGKSTLLKIITGVLTPTSGSVTVNGRISSLLELGTGFNPEFTGIENIYFYGTINGFTKEQMDEKFDSILSFADIGEFINQPVKTYSSGMFVRLAFACAIQIEPEILIVDEALSVGDMFFQAKCMQYLRLLIDNNVTFFFVSHELSSIKQMCSKAILLSKGNLNFFGKSDIAADLYFKSVFGESSRVESYEKTTEHNWSVVSKQLKPVGNELVSELITGRELFEKRASLNRIQNFKAEIKNVQLTDSKGDKKLIFDYGEVVKYNILVYFNQSLSNLNISYHIRTFQGIDIVYGDTRILKKLDILYKGQSYYLFNWTFKLNLMHGNYSLNCGLSIPPTMTNENWELIDIIPNALDFKMNARELGMIDGFVTWENEFKINYLKE